MKKTVNWNIVSTTILGVGYTQEKKFFGRDWMLVLPFCAIMWQYQNKAYRKMLKREADSKKVTGKEEKDGKG